MGMSNWNWEKHEGRDAEGDKFCLHHLVNKESSQVIATVAAPSFADGYTFNVFFDAHVPDVVLNTDQSFVFTGLDEAKTFAVKHLERAEGYLNSIKSAQKSLEY